MTAADSQKATCPGMSSFFSMRSAKKQLLAQCMQLSGEERYLFNSRLHEVDDQADSSSSKKFSEHFLWIGRRLSDCHGKQDFFRLYARPSSVGESVAISLTSLDLLDGKLEIAMPVGWQIMQSKQCHRCDIGFGIVSRSYYPANRVG